MKHNHLTTNMFFDYSFSMSREAHNRLQALESDRRWRIVKTVYIVLAVVLILAAGGITAALNAQQHCTIQTGHDRVSGEWWKDGPTYTYSDCSSASTQGDAASPIIVGFVVSVLAVLVYYFVVPRVYLYLRGSESGKSPHS